MSAAQAQVSPEHVFNTDSRVGHSDESLIPSKILCNRHILEHLQWMSLSVVKSLYAIFDSNPATTTTSIISFLSCYKRTHGF